MSFDQRIRNIIQDEIRMGMGVTAGAKKTPVMYSPCVPRKPGPIKRNRKTGKPTTKQCSQICLGPKLKLKGKGGVVVEDVGSLWHPEMYGQSMMYPIMGRGMVGSAKPKRKRGGIRYNPWVIFLKQYAVQNGISYGDAMRMPGIRKVYEQYKGQCSY